MRDNIKILNSRGDILKENTINSLNEYFSSIEQLKDNYYASQSPADDYSNIQPIKNPVDNSFLFRGMSNNKYQLLPGVFRKNTSGKAIYTTYTTEIDLLKFFIQEASAYLTIPSDDYVRWAEYAQHFGVPTRFLDWSSNPLVALYVCCKNNPDTPGTVWVLNRKDYERITVSKQNLSHPDKDRITCVKELLEGKSSLDYPIVYTPSYVDSRMSAQGSYFMVWGKNEEPLDKLIPESIADSISELNENTCLWQFSVPANSKKKILRSLDDIGINEKTLFPGLEGIGRYIENKFKFDNSDLNNMDVLQPDTSPTPLLKELIKVSESLTEEEIKKVLNCVRTIVSERDGK